MKYKNSDLTSIELDKIVGLMEQMFFEEDLLKLKEKDRIRRSQWDPSLVLDVDGLNYFEFNKRLENNLYVFGLRYLQEVILHNIVLIKLRHKRRNIFISIENSVGKVLYHYSFGRVVTRSRDRFSKHGQIELGRKIGEYLKKERYRKILFVVRRGFVWRFKHFHREVKKHVRILGRIAFPILHVGKRRLPRHKRRKSTRRFR